MGDFLPEVVKFWAKGVGICRLQRPWRHSQLNFSSCV